MVKFTILGSSENGMLMLAETGLLWLQRNNCDYASVMSTYNNTQVCYYIGNYLLNVKSPHLAGGVLTGDGSKASTCNLQRHLMAF